MANKKTKPATSTRAISKTQYEKWWYKTLRIWDDNNKRSSHT